MDLDQLLIVDDFYPDPDALRERALALEYTEPEGLTGFRSPPLHPDGVRERIEETLGRHLEAWERASEPRGANGVFFLAFDEGERAEVPGIHWDEPEDFVTMLVYLTPGLPPDCGTSLWRHRATGLSERPTADDAAALETSVEALEEAIVADAEDRSAWEKIDRIGHVYNRAVFYRAGRLHSATRHHGGALGEGRIYHSFHFALGAPL